MKSQFLSSSIDIGVKCFLLNILIGVLPQLCHAQNTHKIDSLLNLLQKEIHDTVRIVSLNALSEESQEKRCLPLRKIHDNGKGFDMNSLTQGNGLKNMMKRAEEIGAKLLIDSYPGNGTTIQLRNAV